ncbi:prepilin-type N-terminal cleavage/methylation domain-containing protein [Psychrobacter sp. 72-O-c]|uniref:prepilin-type N-terminal cleavage/methylation domain-containing protein n=1 Tax=Psychrobacter sp. 72-O-c TaxID=2774125 RepID=UPI0019184562|nr:prepilin-type N-terminal cleavage/methylation domain-containing protein [Psychrobacter sp. 72-O-c]
MIKPVRAPLHSSRRGFTLIEMMIIVIIIAVLAAFAIPSYRRYVVMNAEREAQAKMLQLQIQLERWRAKTLSYKGFIPQVVNSDDNSVTYSYAENDNQTIYIPDGSGSDTYRYQITLVDGVSTGSSLVSTELATGRTWKMLAEPNTPTANTGENLMMMTSTGLRCQSKNDVEIDDDDCGTNQESW